MNSINYIFVLKYFPVYEIPALLVSSLHIIKVKSFVRNIFGSVKDDLLLVIVRNRGVFQKVNYPQYNQ